MKDILQGVCMSCWFMASLASPASDWSHNEPSCVTEESRINFLVYLLYTKWTENGHWMERLHVIIIHTWIHVYTYAYSCIIFAVCLHACTHTHQKLLWVSISRPHPSHTCNDITTPTPHWYTCFQVTVGTRINLPMTHPTLVFVHTYPHHTHTILTFKQQMVYFISWQQHGHHSIFILYNIHVASINLGKNLSQQKHTI